MKIEMFDGHQAALRAIRALKNVSDAQVLDLLRCLLCCATKRDTPIGNIVLDCCEAVEIEVENDARLCIEAEQEAYARSPQYREDQRNEAVSRGA